MKAIVEPFWKYVSYIGALSFVINVLMLTPAFFMLSVLDKVLTSRSNMTLLVLLGLALYALVIAGILFSLQSRLFNRFGAAFKKVLAPRVLDISLRGIRQPELARHGLDDVNELESFLTGQGIKAFFELPWIPIFIFVLYLFHPALALTALVLALVLFALALAEDRLTAAHQKRANEFSRRASTFAFVARQNAETISALGMQAAAVSRWSLLNDAALDHGSRAARTSSRIQGVAKFVRVGGQMFGLAVGAYLLLNVQDVSAGIMIASLLIMGRTLTPIDHVIGAWKSFVGARTAYGRLSRLLAETQSAQAATVRLPRPRGEVFVEQLYFHLSREQQILNGIHFTLEAGESVGIIGPSGSGKTTLARMIVGLLKPSQGHVRLDGADVYQWAASDLGQYVGYLPQEVVLFPGTVAENIARMGDPEAHTDAVIEAAKKAGAHGMILKLPKGYATEVGEGGARLSGGQRQLVGLARALFGNPSLVVLDEPNANLDSAAEASLIEAMGELKQRNVTVAIITHKPSVVRDVDRLLVLRGGRQNLFGRNEDVLRVLNAAQPPKLAARDKRAALPSQPREEQPTLEEAQ